MSLTARFARGKVYCGRHGCHGQLPMPAAREIRQALDGQVVFELDGWQADDTGMERRVGRRRGSRSIQRASANTDAMLDGEKMKAYEVATADGRRAKTLPFEATCPKCGTVSIIDDALAAVVV